MAMTTEQAVEVFEGSLTRCLEAGDFMGAFYERFMGASEEVRERFAHTDFDKQKRVLKESLYLMSRACLGHAEGLEHLESVARSHSRRYLDITPSLYQVWLDALIVTAGEFDGEFSESIETAWKQLLQPGIERMVEVYRKEDTIRPTR
jgi:hemoglobin-like flavoprotein